MSLALVGGVFDPFHAGHLAYLRVAAAYGRLVCAVSDSDKHPPLVPLADRVALMAVMPFVVHVTDESITDCIRRYRPNYYIKGEEWAGCLPQAEVDACKAVGTEIVYVSCRRNSSSLLLQDYQQRLNAQAVREFEQVVQSQKPADKPWEPVTDYSLEGRRKAEGKHPQLIKEVFNPSEALDVGCGPGHFLRLLRERDVWCFGFDKNPEYFSVGDDEDPFIWTDDIVDYGHEYGSGYQLVICREVLEHLTVKQIRQAVRNLVRLSSKYIYVTTRFAAWPTHPYDVQDHDDLDPTHISLLPKELLRSWFVAEGCKSRYDLEARLDWQHKGRCLVFEV